jgi:hypothetical protein
MSPIYHLSGLSCASIVHDESFVFDPTYVVKDYRMLNLRPADRKDAYGATSRTARTTNSASTTCATT